MGYAFLTIALLAGATKGYCGKKMGTFATNAQSAILLNLVRMLLCTVFGILMVFAYNDAAHLSLNPTLLLISALSGISTSAFVVAWIMAVRKAAYMLLDIFGMLGALVPMAGGYFLFGEGVSAKQWIGFLLLIAAVIILYSYNNSIKIKLTKSAFILLILCGLTSGLIDFSQKTFVKVLPEFPITIFNLYTYFFATITLAVAYIFLKEKPKETNLSFKKYVYIAAIAVLLIISSYFKTKAAIFLDSAQLYPLNQGMSLILSSLMAAIFFKEKLTLKCISGICVAFIGLIFMNVL